ncbi:hypothetical protein [uncultured Nocardioides sp.]|uniref:hypothetical protein n=1 Tax=uncultured Nocardioides sp. TaxID=198441 RepID=UPI002610A0C1|nr:hypothetical protein [uncultured Nocardioides sp.]
MTTTAPRRRPRRTLLLLAVGTLALVAAGVLAWRVTGSDAGLRLRLGTADGVQEVGSTADGTWLRLEPDLDAATTEATLREVAGALTRRTGAVAIAPASSPTDDDGVPAVSVEVGPDDGTTDLAPVLEALGSLPADLDVTRVSVRSDAGRWRLDARTDGDPGDLPVVAGTVVDSLAAAGADVVTVMHVEVGIAAGAGELDVECPGGVAGTSDRLVELIRAQGPGWAVGTTVGCVGPSTAEFLVQDAADRAPQRRRAARELSDDWTFSVGGG